MPEDVKRRPESGEFDSTGIKASILGLFRHRRFHRFLFISIQHHKSDWIISSVNGPEQGFFGEISFGDGVGVGRDETFLVFSYIQLHDRPDCFSSDLFECDLGIVFDHLFDIIRIRMLVISYVAGLVNSVK